MVKLMVKHMIKLIGNKYLSLNEDDGSCWQDLRVIFVFRSLDVNANVYRICAKQCHLISPQQWLFLTKQNSLQNQST